MKFEDWVIENDYMRFPSPWNLYRTKTEGLHVIGTCEKCAHALEESDFGGVHCKSQILCEYYNEFFPPDYGCINFREQEKIT